MNSSHIEPTGVRHLYPIPVVKFSAYLVGQPTPRLEVSLHEQEIDEEMKVLVIEDEPLIRDIYSEFLELMGHEADVAADGREGLGRFDPLVHKVVVTDFLMPGLTGLEIAEAIRARSRTTPVVLISGSAEQPDERRAEKAGLLFLRKPISFAQFKATLAAVVEPAGAAK